MAEPRNLTGDLKALRNMLDEARLVISTANLPQNRTARAVELLDGAILLTSELIEAPQSPAAKELGARGGTKTAERGPEYYAKIAAMRKTRAGGRARSAD